MIYAKVLTAALLLSTGVEAGFNSHKPSTEAIVEKMGTITQQLNAEQAEIHKAEIEGAKKHHQSTEGAKKRDQSAKKHGKAVEGAKKHDKAAAEGTRKHHQSAEGAKKHGKGAEGTRKEEKSSEFTSQAALKKMLTEHHKDLMKTPAEIINDAKSSGKIHDHAEGVIKEHRVTYEATENEFSEFFNGTHFETRELGSARGGNWIALERYDDYFNWMTTCNGDLNSGRLFRTNTCFSVEYTGESYGLKVNREDGSLIQLNYENNNHCGGLPSKVTDLFWDFGIPGFDNCGWGHKFQYWGELPESYHQGVFFGEYDKHDCKMLNEADEAEKDVNFGNAIVQGYYFAANKCHFGDTIFRVDNYMCGFNAFYTQHFWYKDCTGPNHYHFTVGKECLNPEENYGYYNSYLGYYYGYYYYDDNYDDYYDDYYYDDYYYDDYYYDEVMPFDSSHTWFAANCVNGPDLF